MSFVSKTFEVLTVGYMKRAGLKNKDMIRLLGISPPTWIRYKRNPSVIPMGVIRRYAQVLRLSDVETRAVVEASR